MRVGMFRACGLAAALAAVTPATATECVEPYGELVQVSEFETVVRIKPECEVLDRAANARRTGFDQSEVRLGSSVVEDGTGHPKLALRPALSDSGELSPRRRSSKRTVSCSDPAVCGRKRIVVAKRSFDCEDGRGYTVGVSFGLSEVRIVDRCRHLMKPKNSEFNGVLPDVLAPDWELDTNPASRPKRRPSRAQSVCFDPVICSGRATARTAAAAPKVQPTSVTAVELAPMEAISVEGATFRSNTHGMKLVAIRNRRYPVALA
jgi:hypothetical protein